jgi:hypothetical protein
MIICELCLHYGQTGLCKIELKVPKGMSCREFAPGIQKFCSNPKDFVNAQQVIDMAIYFGMKGTELKKVRHMAANVQV